MQNPQEGAGAPLARWMGRWVTEAQREAEKATQPRTEVPLVMPDPEPEVITLHNLRSNRWYRASLLM